MTVKKKLEKDLTSLVEQLNMPLVGRITVEQPTNASHGDYSTNIAMRAVTPFDPYDEPFDIAQKLVEIFNRNKPDYIERAEAVKPGFINFFLSNDHLSSQLGRVLEEKERYGRGKEFQGQKIMLEFAHPNTHKLFHIGHLRNITLGEAVCRLLEAQGATVFRVNYQGDIGLHIAKALWGIRKLGMKKLVTLDEQVAFLAKAYVNGNKAYEKDERVRQEIEDFNRKVYKGDRELTKLWQETREWSLDYFDRIYKRVGTKFDRLYFESEVADLGKTIVLEHLGKVFLRDQGAVIFPGDKYGLHKRVFINSIGLPTYEAKDVGLAQLQLKEFGPDRVIHVVGPEQSGYFEVVFKALEMLSKEFRGKEYHLEYGFVRLKEGKMSSRTGEVVEGEWLLDEAKRWIRKQFPEINEETAEKVAVGAVKYSMLKFSTASDMSFSFDESISLEGDSGPYLQYTFARTQSVLRKFEARSTKSETISNNQIRKSMENGKWKMENEEVILLRTIHRFPEVVEEASQRFAPNLLCHYLFDLASAFNLFYQKHPIIESEVREFRLRLTAGVGQILKNGLKLLGIATPERM